MTDGSCILNIFYRCVQFYLTGKKFRYTLICKWWENENSIHEYDAYLLGFLFPYNLLIIMNVYYSAPFSYSFMYVNNSLVYEMPLVVNFIHYFSL